MAGSGTYMMNSDSVHLHAVQHDDFFSHFDSVTLEYMLPVQSLSFNFTALLSFLLLSHLFVVAGKTPNHLHVVSNFCFEGRIPAQKTNYGAVVRGQQLCHRLLVNILYRNQVVVIFCGL